MLRHLENAINCLIFHCAVVTYTSYRRCIAYVDEFTWIDIFIGQNRHTYMTSHCRNAAEGKDIESVRQ